MSTESILKKSTVQNRCCCHIGGGQKFPFCYNHKFCHCWRKQDVAITIRRPTSNLANTSNCFKDSFRHACTCNTNFSNSQSLYRGNDILRRLHYWKLWTVSIQQPVTSRSPFLLVLTCLQSQTKWATTHCLNACSSVHGDSNGAVVALVLTPQLAQTLHIVSLQYGLLQCSVTQCSDQHCPKVQQVQNNEQCRSDRAQSVKVIRCQVTAL